jgi:hypothetical protein
MTTSEKRLENLKQLTEDLGRKHRFWFTTKDHLNPATFLTGKIWQVAGRKGWCSFFDNPREMEEIT